MDDVAIDFDEPVPDLLTYWANQREASAARRKHEIRPGSKGMARECGEVDENRIFHEISARRVPARSTLIRTPRKSIYDPIEDKRPARLRLGVDKGYIFWPPADLLLVGENLSGKEIARIVGKARGFSFEEILSIRRHKSLVEARQEGVFYVWALTSLSLPQIGKVFGGRDHTTILHAVRKVCRQKGLDYDSRSDCCDSASESFETIRLQAAGVCIDLPHAGSWLARRSS